MEENKYIEAMSLLFILLLSGGCFHGQALYDDQYGKYAAAKDAIVLDLDADEETLVGQLGRPLKREEKVIDNWEHDDLDDLLIYYYYPGLEIIFYHHRHPQYVSRGIAQITISTNGYRIGYDARIGMPVSEIYRRFGESHFPARETDGLTYIGYWASDGLHDQLSFAFKHDKLVKYTWSNWP